MFRRTRAAAPPMYAERNKEQPTVTCPQCNAGALRHGDRGMMDSISVGTGALI